MGKLYYDINNNGLLHFPDVVQILKLKQNFNETLYSKGILGLAKLRK